MNISLDPVDFLNFGDVFYLEIPDVEGIHYMVVVNTCPQENEVIVLGVITSKVEKRKEFIRLAGKNPLSFVEFDYKVHSAIDCNNLKTVAKKHLREKVKSGTARVADSLPESLMSKIFDGIIAGDAPQRLKNLIQNIR